MFAWFGLAACRASGDRPSEPPFEVAHEVFGSERPASVFRFAQLGKAIRIPFVGREQLCKTTDTFRLQALTDQPLFPQGIPETIRMRRKKDTQVVDFIGADDANRTRDLNLGKVEAPFENIGDLGDFDDSG